MMVLGHSDVVLCRIIYYDLVKRFGSDCPFRFMSLWRYRETKRVCTLAGLSVEVYKAWCEGDYVEVC